MYCWGVHESHTHNALCSQPVPLALYWPSVPIAPRCQLDLLPVHRHANNLWSGKTYQKVHLCQNLKYK